MKDNQNLSSPKKGMNRDAAPYNLQENEYSFALNTIFESESGDTYNPKNEFSNILAATFPEGFKVIGVKNDIKGDRTIYWITNPDTGISQIGYIKPGGQYTTLVEDSHDKGLNFDIRKPIKKIELKYEKLKTTAYWVDNNNPDRYINLSSVEDFLTDGRLDVDKLRIDKKHQLPTITPVSIESGGQLEKGVYEVSLTYCDKLGNEVAEYISTTNPIHIYDNNNRTMDNTELGEKTNQAIKLRVDNLDSQYKFYKVFIVKRQLDSTSYFIEGIHPVDDKEIIISTVQEKERTDINKLLATKTSWVRSEGVTSSNGYLFRYGLTAEKEWNLQPVANLMGSFVRWQTVAAPESLYSRGEASALYKGYYRDEVYPLSVRFETNTGYKTALFPLISRPATTYKIEGQLGLEVVNELDNVENIDTRSVNELSPDCSTEVRNKHWQFYNTAHDVKRCDDYEGETVKVTQPMYKYSLVENINTLQKGEIYLDLSEVEQYINLQAYIDENGGGISSGVPEGSSYSNAELQAALDDKKDDIYGELYYDKFDEETGLGCQDPVRIEQTLLIQGIENESVSYIKKDKEDYALSRLMDTFQVHQIDNEGKPKEIEEEVLDTLVPISEFDVYERRVTYDAEKCVYAQKLPQKEGAVDRSIPIVAPFGLSKSKSDLILDTPSEAIPTGKSSHTFSDKLHKGVTWFESAVTFGDKAIIEMVKHKKAEHKDLFSTIDNLKARVSIYTGRCSNPKLVKVLLVDLREPSLLEEESILASELEDNKFFIAIDFPIVEIEDYYLTAVPSGAYGIEIRAEEYIAAVVSYDKIILDKREKYEVDCTFEVPVFNGCKPQPHENGKFAYWESIENYPVNEEMYDSSKLLIEETDIPVEHKADFEKYFTASKVNGKYLLKKDTNFAGKPIRHFKFPDFNVAPFMSTNQSAPFSEAIIYPLGVTVDKEVVKAFLDVAVKNELITQEQRDTITSFEIFRGDRRINKSIVGKGLAFDMYSYEEEEEEVLFPNFPYNDLGQNKLAYKNDKRKEFISHPNRGRMNNRFTFHSPDYDFYGHNVGGEAKVEAYQFGSSRGHFVGFEDHPEWVILGEKSYKVATTLAIMEYALEKAIRIMENGVQAAQGLWAVGGFVVGTGAPGSAVGAALIAAIEVTEFLLNSAPVIGRYRYEWLKIFRDLGKPENFAAQYTSEGHYNYALPNNWKSNSSTGHKGNSLRGISTGKALKEGRFTFREKDGKQIKINNLDRERSTLLTFGEDYSLVYPLEYVNHDNSDVDPYASSRFIASQDGVCSKGKSKELHKNIASPYISIKNYVPFQYGSISSVKWLPTSKVMLEEKDNCYTIFGGDIFISRYTLKRKAPLYATTAFGQADMQPFEYLKHSNIGSPRFYCDYELGNERNIGDILFPDFESNYDLDCLGSKNDMYIKQPAKLYLNFYGIPNFLVESEINLNLRYGKKELKNSFYPEVGDFDEWTQEKNVSIREPNSLLYNNVYSSVATFAAYRTLPDYYSKEEFDTIYDSPSGVIYSMQDNSENDLTDPWLVYRPLDKHQFPTSYGKLIDLKGVSSAEILGRFENTTVLFNAVNQYRDAQTSTTRELGTGGIFYARPIEFSHTELGYRGSSTYQIISNEAGNFYPDAERGQVFLFAGSGSGSQIHEISSQIGKQKTGMKAWFKEHLPFKVKNPIVENHEKIDTDNAFNGLGITMGWDAKYDRVFLTKLDYAPIKEMSYHDGRFMVFDCNDVTYCQFPNKQQTIQEKLDEGYKFIEENCQLVFQKYLDSCNYEATTYKFPEDQKQALVQEGYTLVGQTGSTLTYEKVENACDPESKKAKIESLINQGYVQDSVNGCTITFVKEVCSFSGQQSEIDALIADGYSLVDETECSKVFEKAEASTNVANDDFVEVDQGQSVTFNVIANDSTGSNQPLGIDSFTTPQHGTLTKISSTTFRYTHDGSGNLSDSFTYKASNDRGLTNEATVELSIVEVTLTFDKYSTNLPANFTGETILEVTSSHPWSSQWDSSQWVSGTFNATPSSGGAGTTYVDVSYIDGKGIAKLNITTRSVTKTYTLQLN